MVNAVPFHVYSHGKEKKKKSDPTRAIDLPLVLFNRLTFVS